MTPEEITAAVRSYECRTVEITGGEPLLQKPVFELMNVLCNEGYDVMLETGGSLDISPVDTRVIKIVDLKCPSSKMMHKNLYDNIKHLQSHDEVKFVIGMREDYDWALQTIDQYEIQKKVGVILFSPVFNVIEPLEIVQWMLDDKIQDRIPNIRFQLQMHKFIWEPETKGV